MENGSGGFMGGKISASNLFKLVMLQRYQISYSTEGNSACGSEISSAWVLLLLQTDI